MNKNEPVVGNHIWLEEEEKKMTFSKDTKVPDAGTFTIIKEDHTLGNMLRMQLLRDERVLFAGYRMPHPLENVMHVKVRTRTEGREAPDANPINALQDAVANLSEELNKLEEKFRAALLDAKHPDGVSSYL